MAYRSQGGYLTSPRGVRPTPVADTSSVPASTSPLASPSSQQRRYVNQSASYTSPSPLTQSPQRYASHPQPSSLSPSQRYANQPAPVSSPSSSQLTRPPSRLTHDDGLPHAAHPYTSNGPPLTRTMSLPRSTSSQRQPSSASPTAAHRPTLARSHTTYASTQPPTSPPATGGGGGVIGFNGRNEQIEPYMSVFDSRRSLFSTPYSSPTNVQSSNWNSDQVQQAVNDVAASRFAPFIPSTRHPTTQQPVSVLVVDEKNLLVTSPSSASRGMRSPATNRNENSHGYENENGIDSRPSTAAAQQQHEPTAHQSVNSFHPPRPLMIDELQPHYGRIETPQILGVLPPPTKPYPFQPNSNIEEETVQHGAVQGYVSGDSGALPHLHSHSSNIYTFEDAPMDDDHQHQPLSQGESMPVHIHALPSPQQVGKGALSPQLLKPPTDHSQSRQDPYPPRVYEDLDAISVKIGGCYDIEPKILLYSGWAMLFLMTLFVAIAFGVSWTEGNTVSRDAIQRHPVEPPALI